MQRLIRPGTDAFLLSAILALIVPDGLEDGHFLEQHTLGFLALRERLMEIPVDEYISRTGVDGERVREAARRLAGAERAAVRVDLGVQQSPNSTLNSYLEKLLFLVTGNLGRKGGNIFTAFSSP